MSLGSAKGATVPVSDEGGVCSRGIPKRPTVQWTEHDWGPTAQLCRTLVALGKSLLLSEPQCLCLSHGGCHSSIAQWG